MAAATVVAIAGLGVGCSLHQAGVEPPDNRIFFPTGAVVDPGGHWLYVINSNSDLRYNSGTLVAVNLDRVRADHDQGGPTPGTPWPTCPPDPRFVPAPTAPHLCCWDISDRNVLVCDEQVYIDPVSFPGGQVRIGSFGTQPLFQQSPLFAGVNRLFVPVRGNSSITFMNIGATADTVTINCTGDRTLTATPAATPFPECDDKWRIISQDADHPGEPDSNDVQVPDEPFAMAVDNSLQLMYVGHLSTGAISLYDIGNGGQPQDPRLVQVQGGILPADASGRTGATALTIRDPESLSCYGTVYVASRYLAVVGAFLAYGNANPNAPSVCDPSFGPTSDVAIGLAGQGTPFTTGLPGAETRGVQLVRNDTFQRAFVLQRFPPAVVAFDFQTGSPISTIEVCPSPISLTKHEGPSGTRLYVTCSDAGEVDVIDPEVLGLRDVIQAGRAPAAIVFDEVNKDNLRAFIVGFGGNNLSVVDIDPTSPTYDHVIQRIGFPSPTPRDVQ